jgi:hypothetical protein
MLTKLEDKQAIVVVLLVVIAIGAWMIFGNSQDDSPSVIDQTPASTIEHTEIGYGLPESIPVRLRIPAIYVDAGFVELGLNADKTIEVPKSYEEVGWYTYGPTPGEMGPAIILGHVDSYKGPAVFFGLGGLKVGDTIEIERADGKTAIFGVDKLERYERSDFPRALVYGDLDYAGLRLITSII